MIFSIDADEGDPDFAFFVPERKKARTDRTAGDSAIASQFQEQADHELALSLSREIVRKSSSSRTTDGEDSLRVVRELQSKEDNKIALKWQEEEDLQFAKQLRKHFEEDRRKNEGERKKTMFAPVDLPLSAQRAMQHVATLARNMSMTTRSRCSDAALNAAVATVQACDVVIHINPANVLKFLARDTHYRNQYETGTGSGALAQRNAVENR